MSESAYSMGPHTLAVPMELFALNRRRLCAALGPELKSSGLPAPAVVLLQGGSGVPRYCTDVEYEFRQESYFHWLVGVREPDCYALLDVNSVKTTIFWPRLDADYSIWMGRLLTLEDVRLMYQVEEVHYVDEIEDVIKQLDIGTLLLLKGVNTDSKLVTKSAHFSGIERFNCNYDLLHSIMAECRVIKTSYEIDVIRYANKISSEAHKQVMRAVRPGMKEYELESLFKHYSYSQGGCRHVAYTCICATGDNSAILHYGHAAAPNDRTLNAGDMCLFDMGAEYCCYASDITCSFPVTGKFSVEQTQIYEAVLAANMAVFNACKPGVSWLDMHLLANRVLLEKLKDIGILTGSIDEMMEANLASVFQPHGLGHLLGCDVHDVGGYIEDRTPPRSPLFGLGNLRTCRHLQAGMVLTIEPGCYFIAATLERVWAPESQLARFVVSRALHRYTPVGGVRIEDNIVVTCDGAELLTQVPRTVQDIEAFMSET